jgi:hypothetical protein
VCDWKRSLLLTSLTWKGLTRRCPWRDSTITLPESTCCRHTRCPATLLLASMVVNADYSRFGLKLAKTAARSTAPPSKIHAASKFFGMFGQQEADRQGWRGLSRVQAGTEPALAGSEPKTPIDAQKTARQVIFKTFSSKRLSGKTGWASSNDTSRTGFKLTVYPPFSHF